MSLLKVGRPHRSRVSWERPHHAGGKPWWSEWEVGAAHCGYARTTLSAIQEIIRILRWRARTNRCPLFDVHNVKG